MLKPFAPLHALTYHTILVAYHQECSIFNALVSSKIVSTLAMASDRELTEFRGRINNLAVVEYAAVDGMVDNNTPNPRQDITTIRKCHDYVPDFFKAVPVILSYTILSPLIIFTLTAIATKSHSCPQQRPILSQSHRHYPLRRRGCPHHRGIGRQNRAGLGIVSKHHQW